ncbi:MAG TPA: glucosamine-6-phosphate deaminase, partial [Gaiellales bacterium]
MIRTVVTADYAALSEAAADAIAAVVARVPDALLLLATGDTPMGAYTLLAERRARGELDTSQLRVAQLDEYAGLAHGDRRSLHGWMERSFLTPLGISEGRTIRLDAALPAERACREYDAAVAAAGGFELAILGLGPNGHLGFNEPPVAAGAPTRLVPLTPASIASNARYWGDESDVPVDALTCGLASLLAARQILLVVSGPHKREILARTLDEAPSEDVPASWLQA